MTMRAGDREWQTDVSHATVLDEPELEAGGFDALDATPGRWWVLHTRARNEKAVAGALQRQAVPHYLPLARRNRTYGRKVVPVELPLFPGYLFLRGEADECSAALKTNRVASVLPVVDQGLFRRELVQIYRVVEGGAPVDVFPALRQGRRCRITGGPFRGIEGVVLRRRGASRLYISASVLGQSAVIEIDELLLEPAD